MTREDTWSADWACQKLIAHNEITTAVALGTNQIELSVKRMHRPVLIATMSTEFVQENDLIEVCTSADIEFVMNIKKDALIDNSAIRFSETNSIGLGSLGDLYSAINRKDFRNYLPRDVQFILRGLRQHTSVSKVDRINNRLYRVERKSRAPKLILALNDYDLTADAVRDGLDRFGACNIILVSNPNCMPSSESMLAAKNCGVVVLKWGALMKAIKN